VAAGFPVWSSKPAATVWWFGTQNHRDNFLFMHQNQVGYGLSVVPQNRWEDEDGIGYTSRSSVLLRLKASRARIFQSSLKTGRGAAQMVHMASLQKSRGDEAEDGRVDATGYIRLFYPNFVVFVVLS
jgi:hypothetical protein